MSTVYRWVEDERMYDERRYTVGGSSGQWTTVAVSPTMLRYRRDEQWCTARWQNPPLEARKAAMRLVVDGRWDELDVLLTLLGGGA